MRCMIQKAVALLCCVLLVTGCGSAPAAKTRRSMPEADSMAGTGTVKLYFFHDTACASCDGTKEFLEIFETQLADVRESCDYTLDLYNIFETTGNAVYQRVLAENGLQENAAPPPVLIINGAALCGLEAIRGKVRELFLSAAESAKVPAQERYLVDKATSEKLFEGMDAPEDATVILYFYRLTCDECNQTKPVIDALPNSVSVDGKQSPVVLYPLNTRTGSNGDRVRRMFQAYHVPEEDQMVPIVFLRDTYLAGYDAISKNLFPMLERGEGLRFAFPQ